MNTKLPLPLTSLQCRAARAILRWGMRELSSRSGVGTTTISRFEKGHSKPIRGNLTVLRHIFEGAGIEFIEDNGLIARNINEDDGEAVEPDIQEK